jgi:hypothetical protein
MTRQYTTPIFQHRHYEIIVDILAKNKYKEHTDILNAFNEYFKNDNKIYKPKRFLDTYNKLTAPIDAKRIESLFNK